MIKRVITVNHDGDIKTKH